MDSTTTILDVLLNPYRKFPFTMGLTIVTKKYRTIMMKVEGEQYLVG